MIRVSLFGLQGYCLIVPAPSGVIYSNQVAGYQTNQAELEGILVPVDCWNQAGTLERVDRLMLDKDRLTVADADEIDALLSAAEFGIPARVDRDRLADSSESWLWLVVDQEALLLVEGLEFTAAVLTTENSD